MVGMSDNPNVIATWELPNETPPGPINISTTESCSSPYHGGSASSSAEDESTAARRSHAIVITPYPSAWTANAAGTVEIHFSPGGATGTTAVDIDGVAVAFSLTDDTVLRVNSPVHAAGQRPSPCRTLPAAT
jgi:hypothetical protein